MKEKPKFNHDYDRNDKSEKYLKIYKNKKDAFNVKNKKKYQMIPNKKPGLKNGINIFKNYLINKNPSSLPDLIFRLIIKINIYMEIIIILLILH